MTNAINTVSSMTDNSESPNPAICAYLQPNLVVNLEVANRKRLLEQFAELITTNATVCHSANGENHPQLDQIFATLHDRERLGSTALGKGIALPHGRIEGLSEPIIAIAKLKVPIDYDSPDNMPIWLAVCLLVPAEADKTHLSLLASLATKFNDDEFVHAVKASTSTAAVYQLFADA